MILVFFFFFLYLEFICLSKWLHLGFHSHHIYQIYILTVERYKAVAAQTMSVMVNWHSNFKRSRPVKRRGSYGQFPSGVAFRKLQHWFLSSIKISLYGFHLLWLWIIKKRELLRFYQPQFIVKWAVYKHSTNLAFVYKVFSENDRLVMSGVCVWTLRG